ncbi:hypothetical protein SO694_00038132 [Aureococcus anophagefferens]|uniref:Uncharacterized protein n=1 Tax=Aureococcus anophagefferens TaxID=44056 RepID=A0ABR1FLV5_AURAN
MFYSADAFDQDIGWCVSSSVSASYFASGAGCGVTAFSIAASPSQTARCRSPTPPTPTPNPTPNPTPKPTPAPSSPPTASVLAITSIGSASTCVHDLECELLWVYRGPGCATVEVSLTDLDGNAVGSQTIANDGQQMQVVAGDAESNEFTLTLKCTDDGSLMDSIDFQLGRTSRQGSTTCDFCEEGLYLADDDTAVDGSSVGDEAIVEAASVATGSTFQQIRRTKRDAFVYLVVAGDDLADAFRIGDATYAVTWSLEGEASSAADRADRILEPVRESLEASIADALEKSWGMDRFFERFVAALELKLADVPDLADLRLVFEILDGMPTLASLRLDLVLDAVCSAFPSLEPPQLDGLLEVLREVLPNLPEIVDLDALLAAVRAAFPSLKPPRLLDLLTILDVKYPSFERFDSDAIVSAIEEAIMAKAFSAYAIMCVFVYPIGIVALFTTLVARAPPRDRPPLGDDGARRVRLEETETVERCGRRASLAEQSKNAQRRAGDDSTLKSIGFLWMHYLPMFWWFEITESVRRLLVTAVAVTVQPGSSTQLAYGLLTAPTGGRQSPPLKDRILEPVRESRGAIADALEKSWGMDRFFERFVAALELKLADVPDLADLRLVFEILDGMPRGESLEPIAI